MWTLELTSAEWAVLKVAMSDLKNKYKGLAYAEEIKSVINKVEIAQWEK